MDYETIVFSLEDGVARLTLARPERLNAFNLRMQQELHDAYERIDAAEVRVLLVTGAGRAFCSGVDLADRKPLPAGEKHDLGASLEAKNPLIARLHRFPFPVVCAVNGVAAGMGASLALACDIVLAARGASFVLAFTRIGLMPDCGASWFLARRAGVARAMAASLLGERIDAPQAEQWGLVWKCVADEALAAEAEALVARLAAGPTLAYARTKQAILAACERPLDDILALESAGQRELGRSDDYAEGVQAFLDKRPARFAGR
jgi:2-(1,2-epoxy-1,2-dihydrophenyl)acetyl-CoA isomerase